MQIDAEVQGEYVRDFEIRVLDRHVDEGVLCCPGRPDTVGPARGHDQRNGFVRLPDVSIEKIDISAMIA